MEWRPIETAPEGCEMILYFPAEATRRGDPKHIERITVDLYPVTYPRKPTHWMPLPPPTHSG